MTTDEAIKRHGAMAVFEAGAAGECEDYEPLQALGLSIETIGEAELISTAAYDRMSTEVRAALHWEASQDLHKDRELINWSGIDFSVGPRMSEEAEADFLERQMLGVLLKAQIEKRRKQV